MSSSTFFTHQRTPRIASHTTKADFTSKVLTELSSILKFLMILPLRKGELEYFDPRFAAEYLTMPGRISNIEKMLE
jgi:hypothetical protein